MIKKLSLVTISSILFLTGCGPKNYPIEPGKDTNLSIKMNNKYQQIAKEIANKKNIEYIHVKSLIYKKININHNLPNTGLKLKFNFNKGMTLLQFSKRIGFPTYVDPSIENKTICFDGEIEGNIKNILNTITSLVNVFWTYDNGVIKFQRTATVIYSFPFLSMTNLSNIYNTGTKDKTNISLKENIFQQIYQGLQVVLNNVQFSGSFSQSWSENEDNMKQNNNKINNNSGKKEQFNKSNIKNIKEGNSKSNAKIVKENNSYINSNIIKNKNLVGGGKMMRGNHKKMPRSMSPSFNYNGTTGDSITNTRAKSNLNTNNNKHNVESINTLNNIKSMSGNKNKIVLFSENKQNSIQKNLKKQYQFKEAYSTPKSKIFVSSAAGVIIAKVTPSEMNSINNIVKNIIQKRLSNLVVVDLFVINTTQEKIKNYALNFNAILQNGIAKKTLNVNGGGIAFGYDTTGAVAATSKVISGLLNYFLTNTNGKILSEPTIVTMPGIPGRIKDSIYYPYVEPAEIPNSTNGAISYNVKNIEEGIDMTVIPLVMNDNSLLISMGLSINQYLGNVEVSAGTAGTFVLPQMAPKQLNSTFRVKPGNVLVIGGIRNSMRNSSKSSETKVILTGSSKRDKDSEFLIIAIPRLIKFVTTDKNTKE